MAGNLGTERSRRGGKGRGEWESADKGGGGCLGNLLEESRVYGDVNWRETGIDTGSRGDKCYGGTTNRLA